MEVNVLEEVDPIRTAAGPPRSSIDGEIRGRRTPGRVEAGTGPGGGRGGRELEASATRCAAVTSRAGKRGRRQLAAERDAALSRFLEGHAERVNAKKLRSAENASLHHASAATRLEDLRNRVRARTGANGRASIAELAKENVEASGSGEPETGNGCSRRNELLKMHSTYDSVANGIHATTACAASSGDAVGEQLRALATSADAANEASRVAWHDVGAEEALTVSGR